MSSLNEDDLIYLKKNAPHLYDIEMQVRRVIAESGFGDVSLVLHITEGVVDRGEILGSAKRIYYMRRHNVMERAEVDAVR
jgi:hypothetical protein